MAGPFLDFAGLRNGERVVDIGCGTGSLTFQLAERANIKSVEAIDYDAGFVEAARAFNTDPRINIETGDACVLQFADCQFDRALSMLVIHFVNDPHRAVAEMRRVVRLGGVAAATVWDNYGGQPSIRMFYDTLTAIEPRATDRRGAALIRPMTRAGELRDAFAKAGFIDIAEATLIVRMDFENFDDYWIPQTTGQGSILEFLNSLPEALCSQIEAAVRSAYLCGQPDGPRSFVSVAWAARGTVPDN